ncbi:putative ribonuclease H-like domain-containing protein [Tanacetum coccineum]
MTGNKAYLAEFQDFNGGPVAFGGSKGYITGKGKIKTRKLDFEDVCFVKELQHFNLFSVSQMCDKKNKVLPNNMYSFNLENIVSSGGLASLIANAIIDESNKWHKRLGHVNFKNLNKLVKGNLVRGLPSKIFQNDHTCVACQKGKQHKASCKAKSVSSISHSLQLLYMDLFGPTSVRSLNHKTYCLVITDDFSRFSWVFFLRTKDETSGILKDFIRQIENQLNQKVKTIRCDNGTEFKNKDVIELCGSKGIKREYSNARTPQQNEVSERKNRTLIEAARTMLADSFLPNTFWAEAVGTACYVLNMVLLTKPYNKTPYELLTGKIPIISYIRPFGCHVTILNTIDHLGKFAGKSDEGFLVGYSLQSKAFRVYNLETNRVEENLHITFLENTIQNVKGGERTTWLFYLDFFADSMNYQPVSVHPKSSHLSAVKRIFRYLKGKPKLGLWYPRVSSFDLESYSDSDYAGANLDRKSTTGGCQFLGRRLISWQCKKQTIVATSTIEAEYVAAASCCGQVLWIQNQMLDYGFNFMNTKIYIDNESTICIVKNPVYHSKTKHIAIRHHFIRDAYEKKLIQVLKIHTDDNVADLLTKAFDVSRGSMGFRESLKRVFDGTVAPLLPTLFILWLATVSIDSAKLVPLGKVCTAIETLKKNTAKGTSIKLKRFPEISSIAMPLTHITAKVAGKPMSIFEASIRSDLLFDDANGIDLLPN